VKVIRGGEETLVLNTDLIVGDVLIVDTGDKLCAGEKRSPAEYRAIQDSNSMYLACNPLQLKRVFRRSWINIRMMLGCVSELHKVRLFVDEVCRGCFDVKHVYKHAWQTRLYAVTITCSQ
jgi:hypothetical protein